MSEQPQTSPVEIVCDESGSDGENLFESAHRVFAHGSVDLSTREAGAIVANVRRQFRITGPELKAKQLLKDSAIDDAAGLFMAGGPLHGRAHVMLIDKLYFAVGKVIDLLVEEEMYEQGVQLHVDGSARQMASDLFRHGRKALGTVNWDRLLGAFVSLIRRRQRTGEKTTLDEFFAVIDDLRLRSHRKDVADVLSLVWAAREQAAQYGDPDQAISEQPNLEPLVAAIHPTALYWAEQYGGPVLLIHDRQTILTDELVRIIVGVANNPHPDLPVYVPIAGIVQADSKADPRVQLADLAAGLGRLAGERALSLTLTPRLIDATRPLIDENCIWDDEPSWRILTGRAVGS